MKTERPDMIGLAMGLQAALDAFAQSPRPRDVAPHGGPGYLAAAPAEGGLRASMQTVENLRRLASGQPLDSAEQQRIGAAVEHTRLAYEARRAKPARLPIPDYDGFAPASPRAPAPSTPSNPEPQPKSKSGSLI